MNRRNRKIGNHKVATYETVSKTEYREMLFARMAGGDLYAMEAYRKIRIFDAALDVFREIPVYPQNKPIFKI